MGSERDSGGNPTAPSRDEVETRAVSAPARDGRDTAMRGTGDTIGRYVVLEEVGRGGMGRVLRAYDPKLQREVALKEVRRESLGREATQRLVAEARAMAKLSHPNVVAVYDVEELSDGVVLVMEYVSGRTLAKWLVEARPDWRTVVQHFSRAGRGLAAAHAVGLLHRDFKPANVLVGDDDAVKVTDFGLAKADGASSSSSSHRELTDELEHDDEVRTRAGTVLGTPRYMAPEQHAGLALTPAADQYAFCVALWNALCGSPPFSGDTLAADKRRGPPSWPRSSVPGRVARAIVRGLSPEPSERWPAMDALLRAIASDASRRRRRGYLVVGGLAVVGAAWLGVTVTQTRRCTGSEAHLAGIWDDARRSAAGDAILGIGRPYAAGVWARARTRLDDYAADWVAMHTEACEAATVRGEQSPQVMDLRMACLHRAAVDLRAVTDQLADADDAVVQHADELMANLRPLSRCADIDALREAVEPPLPEEADDVESIRAHLATAAAARGAGRYAAAAEAVEAAERELEGVAYGPIRTEVALERGTTAERLGDDVAAEEAYRAAMRSASEWRQWTRLGDAATKLIAVVGASQRRVEEGRRYAEVAQGLAVGDPDREGRVLDALALTSIAAGEYDVALTQLRRALELWQPVLGSTHPRVVVARGSISRALSALGKNAEAEAGVRQTLADVRGRVGPDHPTTATWHSNLGSILYTAGKFPEAEAEHREALRARIAALGPDHRDVAVSRGNLGLTLGAEGKLAEAEEQLRLSLAVQVKILGPEHPDVAQVRSNLTTVLVPAGKFEEAEVELRRALQTWERTLGPDHPNLASVHGNLGTTLARLGRPAEAAEEYRQTLRILEKTLGPEHPMVAQTHSNLGACLHEQHEYAEAMREHRLALAGYERALDPDHPHLALGRTNLAVELFELGEVDEARELAEKAWQRRQRDDTPPMERGLAAFVLARALWPGGDRSARTRARALAEGAREDFRASDLPDAKDHLRTLEEWLVTHGANAASR